MIVGARFEPVSDDRVRLYVSMRVSERDAEVWSEWDLLRYADGEVCAGCGDEAGFGSVDGEHLPPLCLGCLQEAISGAAELRAELESCAACRGELN